MVHRDDYRDVSSTIISYDTIHDPAQLMVSMKDPNSTVSADAELAEAFLSGAREMSVPCKKVKVLMRHLLKRSSPSDS